MARRTIRVLFRGEDSGYSKVTTALIKATVGLQNALNKASKSQQQAAKANVAAATAQAQASQQARASAASTTAAANAEAKNAQQTKATTTATQAKATQTKAATASTKEATAAQQSASTAEKQATEATNKQTEAVNKKTKAVNAATASVKQLDTGQSKATRSARGAKSQLDKTAKGYNNAAKGADNLNKKAGDSAKGMSASNVAARLLNHTLGQLRGVILGVGLVALAMAAVNAADGMTLLRARTALAFSSLQQTEQAISDITNIANTNAVSLTSVGNLYSRIAINSQRLAQDQRSLRDIVNTVSAAFVVGGATAAEQASGILQLSQAFASGRLQGEEFRAVAESAPPLLGLLADATGRTRAELRAMSAAGLLTSEVMAKAFTSAEARKIQEAAKNFPETLGRATTRLLNNLRLFVADLNDQLGLTQSIASAVGFVASNLDTVSMIAVVAAGIIGGPLVASLGASAVAFARNTTQVVANNIAVARSQGVSAAAAVSQTVLARSIGLLGGPISAAITGLALLAAGLAAIAQFEDQNAQVIDATTKAIESLNKVQGAQIFASVEVAKAKQAEVKQRIAVVSAILAELEAREALEARSPNRVSPTGITAGLAGARADQERQKLAQLKNTLADLEVSIDDADKRYEAFLATLSDDPASDAEAAAKAFASLTDSLDSQIESLRQQQVELTGGREALLDHQEAIALATATTDKDREAIRQRFSALRGLTAAVEASREAQQRETEAQREAQAAATRVLQTQRDITEAQSPLIAAQNEYNELLADLQGLATLSDEQLKALGLSQADLAQITRQATADLDRQKEAIRAHTDETLQALAEIEQAGIDGLSAAFGDFVASGFTQLETFRDGVLDIARGIVSDLIATFARNQIVVPIVASLSGAGAGTGGLIQQLGSFLPALSTPTFSTINAAGVPIPVQTGTQLTGFGNFAAGAGIGALTSSFIGGSTASSVGGIVGGGLGQLGGAEFLSSLGPVAGPIGSVIGSALGSIIGGLFSKSPRLRLGGFDTDIKVNDKTDGFVDTALTLPGRAARVSFRKASVEDLDKFSTALQRVDAVIAGSISPDELPRVAQALDTFFVSIKGKELDPEQALKARLGFIANTLGGEIPALLQQAGQSLDEQLARFQDVLAIDNLIDSGASILGADTGLTATVQVLESLAGTGEDLRTTYNRVVAQSNAYLNILAATGQSTDLTGEALVRFSDDLVKAAGGLDVLQRQFNTVLQAFFDPLEVLEIQAVGVRDAANTALGEIGLDLNTITRDDFAEQFRATLASNDAELIASFARAGELLAQVFAIEEQIAQARMQRAEEEAAQAAAAADAQRANANASLEVMASSDAQQQQLIEEMRQKAVQRYEVEQAALEAAAAAERQRRSELNQLIGGVDQQIFEATASEFEIELNRVQQAIAETTQQAIALGASEEQLARIRQLQSLQLDDLASRAIDTLKQLTSEFSDGLVSSVSTGINQVANAANSLLSQWQSGINSLRSTIDGIRLNPALGGLEGGDRLNLAQSLFDGLAARAEGGDLEALQQLPAALQQLATIAVDVEASGQDSRAIIDAAIARAESLRPPSGVLAQPPSARQVQAIGSTATDIAENTAEQAQRAQQIIDTLAFVAGITERSALDIAAELSVPLADVVSALNVDVAQPTVESVARLGLIAEQLQTGLGDLAREIGADIGQLTDSGSMLNEALRQAISGLGPEITDQLVPQLEAVESAAGPAAQAQALGGLESAVAALAPDLRNQLAPFFDGIDVSTEAQRQVQALDQSVELATLQLDELRAIRIGLSPGSEATNELPSFAVGTGFVRKDMVANIHKGEAIFPAPVAEFFRREGLPINRAVQSSESTSNEETIRLLKRLLEETEKANKHNARQTGQLIDTMSRGNNLTEKNDRQSRYRATNTRGCNGRS